MPAAHHKEEQGAHKPDVRDFSTTFAVLPKPRTMMSVVNTGPR